MKSPPATEQGSVVLVVLMLLVALAGIQSALGQFGRAVEQQLHEQEERHNTEFQRRLTAN